MDDWRCAPSPSAMAYLELAHDWRNLLLERLIRDFTTTEVDLVTDENDGNLWVSSAMLRVCRYARHIAARAPGSAANPRALLRKNFAAGPRDALRAHAH